MIRLVLVALVVPVLVGPVQAVEPTPTMGPLEVGSSAVPGLQEQPSLMLGPPHDRSIGDWREIGRTTSGDIVLSHLSVVDGRLVAYATACDLDSCRDLTYHSIDGITWVGSDVPGSHPAIYDMAVTPDGSMAVAVGLTHRRGQGDVGAVWSTRDGVEWTQASAPPVPEIDWVAASADAVVVSTGQGLWLSRDLGSWRRVRGPGSLPLAFGPGGFVAFGGGGQDVMSATKVWQSSDGRQWSKVDLPKALRTGDPAFGDIQVFALDKRWVLVPDDVKLPRTIYVSRNGRDWRRAPRPRWMAEGYVWWIDDLAGGVQAFGWAPERRRRPNGLWTWRLGKAPGEPVWWRHERIGRPVVWRGQRIALGEAVDTSGVLTLWRWEPLEAGTDQHLPAGA